MADVKEFKTTDPWDYKAPADKAQVVTLQERRFAWIAGQGDPNGPDFQQATGALYGFSYAVRMSYRGEKPPRDAGPYTVGLLQGRWDIVTGQGGFSPAHKDRLAWIIMIRQPDFLDEALFSRFVEEARVKAAKKGEVDPRWFDGLRFGLRDGGRFAQIMHVGPYDAEPATFALLERSLAEQGAARRNKRHWEIYHGDPRRTKPEKLKTILRVEIDT
jgi:hypothetical protein